MPLAMQPAARRSGFDAVTTACELKLKLYVAIQRNDCPAFHLRPLPEQQLKL